MSTHQVNITFNGKIIGTAEVESEDGLVAGEFELEPDEYEQLFPQGSAVEGLSIAPREVDRVDLNTVLRASYYKNRPKGTFDA